MKQHHTVLSIAGSDPIGGAGIQADIKTCTALGAYAMTAITALTAQNSTGVKGVAVTDPDFLKLQLDTVLTDVRPDAVKTGMLPEEEAVRITTDAILRYDLKNVVVDPVLVATSGDTLAGAGARRALMKALLPLATVATPNIPECEAFINREIAGPQSMEIAAAEFQRLTGCQWVLLKGGHGVLNSRHGDLLYSVETGPLWHEHPHIDTPNTHGTGCTLSSAIAALLAQDLPVQTAVYQAIDWLSGAIKSGADFTFGTPGGHGPVNHLWRSLSASLVRRFPG